jgi:PAS domain S-box-containing protein
MATEARSDNSDTQSYFDSSLWNASAKPAAGIARAVAEFLKCDEVHVFLEFTGHPSDYAQFALARGVISNPESQRLFSFKDKRVFYQQSALPAMVTANDISRARIPASLVSALSNLGAKSFGLFRVTAEEGIIGYIACFYKRSFHRWLPSEVAAFERIHLRPHTNSSIEAPGVVANVNIGSVERYQRLATHGNIVILTTDRDFCILDVFGNSEQLIGYPAERLKGDPSVWAKIVDPRDAPNLIKRIVRLREERNELQEEVRIIHRRTGELRWIHLRAVPYADSAGKLLGWEGFGVDVTDRRLAQDALLKQNGRLEALFEIAQSLKELHESAAVTLTGLRAVLRATGAECGYAVLTERESSILEVVAAIGLSEDYLVNMHEILDGPSLLTEAIASKTGLFIDNLQDDTRARRALAKREGLTATIVSPMLFESTVYGAFVLFKRGQDPFLDEDYELASAAASQITLAIRQAENFESQRRQSASLGSLFKVSRELAKYRAAVDFGEQILPVLKEEFALKRGWIGITNDQSTFIVGRAGFGPDVSPEVVNTQIEIDDSQSILDELLTEQRPVVLDDLTGEINEGLLTIFPDPSSLILVPVVAIGQVMGVLVLEPLSSRTFATSDRLQLLVSMANEMATAMIAGRFESKMANAVKMRTAGLLASGVAHNFNNLLQTIVGQVSLINLQANGNHGVSQASKVINDAVMRGASLVSQLLNFAAKGPRKRVRIELSSFFRDSLELYSSLLGRDISLICDDQLPEGVSVLADSNQLQQVITNMLANSKEAIGDGGGGEVSISTHSVIVRSGDLGPDISPGSYARIDLRDNGAGMSDEAANRCFEPFYTTKNIDRDTGVGLSGTGLGLAAAYSIVREHDGAITVHSREGEGSIFSIYIPIVASERQSKNTAEVYKHAKSVGVLLLGVESGVQPFVSSALESLGCVARGVFDLRQARELIEREPSTWNIIMIDKEGLGSQESSACKDVASMCPSISVVCLCSQGFKGGQLTMGESDEGVVGAKGTYHIEKPITVWGLEKIINKIRADLKKP